MAKDPASVSEDELAGLSDEERAALSEENASDEAETLQTIIGDDDDDDDESGDEGKDAANSDEGNGDDTDGNDEAGEGADDEGAAAEAAKGEQVDTTEKVPREFNTVLAVEPVEDYDNKMKDIADKKAALRSQLDDGDIDLNKYEEEKDKLVQQETDMLIKQNNAISAQKQNEHNAKQRWDWEQEQFFEQKQNEIYSDPIIGAALNTAVINLAKDPKNVDWSGSKILAEADKMVRERFKLTAPANKKPDARKPDLSGIPKTLGDLPAAENTDTGNTEFAHLEKLEGMELEAALAKMPKEQQDRYLRS